MPPSHSLRKHPTPLHQSSSASMDLPFFPANQGSLWLPCFSVFYKKCFTALSCYQWAGCWDCALILHLQSMRRHKLMDILLQVYLSLSRFLQMSSHQTFFGILGSRNLFILRYKPIMSRHWFLHLFNMIVQYVKWWLGRVYSTLFHSSPKFKDRFLGDSTIKSGVPKHDTRVRCSLWQASTHPIATPSMWPVGKLCNAS